MQVTVETDDYPPAKKTVSKGADKEIMNVDFELMSVADAQLGHIRGAIKAAGNDEAIRGELIFPSINKKVKADEEGHFDVTLKPGRYAVLIRAPHFLSQKKEIKLEPGDVVILNIDLAVRRR